MIKYCKSCLMPSTRPRIKFNDEGVCNACEWKEIKKSIDWKQRQDWLKLQIPGKKVFVPYSGGKDSIYVAYKMKEMGADPTLVTVLPHMETEMGEWNRKHMCPGFPRVEISLNDDKYRRLARHYFVEQGRPKHPWEAAISAQVMKYLVNSEEYPALLMYGEEGEAEYGGSDYAKDKWKLPVDKKYLNEFYYCGNNTWELPSDDVYNQIFMTHWSKFENWSPSKHGNFAVVKGMRTEPIRSIGSLTTYSQLSDKLQDLHMYMAFVKFGFGRCTADVCIAIRDGWMNREEALAWVEQYDGEFPWKYLAEYLEYFDMKREEFFGVIDSHADTEIMRKDGYVWRVKEEVQEKRRL